MGKFTSAMKGVVKGIGKNAKKVSTNVMKQTKGTAKSNIAKALKKKDTAIASNKNTAASNISTKKDQTSVQKDQLNTTVNKGKDQITSAAKDTSGKVNQTANLDKAQAMKENFASQSSAMKEQHKLNMLQKKLDNKAAAQENKNRLDLEKQQFKHEQAMQKQQDQLELAKKNAQQKQDTAAANKQAALDRKAEEQKQQHQLNMAMKKQNAETTAATKKKFAEATLDGLMPHQKWAYHRAQKRQANLDIRKAQAGIDPKTGRLQKPTILPTGQVVGVAGAVQAPAQTASSNMGNAMNTALQIGMTGQILGGMFGSKTDGGGASNTPSGVPEKKEEQTTTPDAPQLPALTPETPQPPSNTSPSHIPPGGVNINVINANKNNTWLGSQIGSNSSSSSTQGGLGINTLFPNKKPSHTSTGDTKEPSPTGPVSSGWLV